MNDNEARYLIDQFNKYASWNVTHWINMFPYLAILLAVFALSFSLPEIDGEIVVLSNPMIRALIPSIAIILVVAAAIWVGWRYNQDSRSLARCVVVLEKHRSRFKSLPDSITLEKLVQSKPDELEKLLKESEPTADSPQP